MTDQTPTNTLTDLTYTERRDLGCFCTHANGEWHHRRFCPVPTVERILAAREAHTNTLRAAVELVAGEMSAAAYLTLTSALDAATAPTLTTHLLHAFDRQTGICRCGDGPFTVPEWVEHYHAQETPTLTERTD